MVSDSVIPDVLTNSNEIFSGPALSRRGEGFRRERYGAPYCAGRRTHANHLHHYEHDVLSAAGV